MAWAIEFERKADKQLGKLNPHDAARIVKLLDEVALLDDPRCVATRSPATSVVVEIGRRSEVYR